MAIRCARQEPPTSGCPPRHRRNPGIPRDEESLDSPVAGDQTVVVSEDDRGGPVAQVELGEEVVDVGFHGAFADEELPGDLAVGVSLADEGKDVPFPPVSWSSAAELAVGPAGAAR